MTIASEIQRIEGNISAAYMAADAKGATIPATENSDNLATCIASIPSGGSVSGNGKYFVTYDIMNANINKLTNFIVNGVDYASQIQSAAYGSGPSNTNVAIFAIELPLGNVYQCTIVVDSGYSLQTNGNTTVDFTSNVADCVAIKLEENL